MNQLIKKHQKKLLAVFSVGLMITFVASSGYGRGAGHRTEVVVGHVGKTPVYNTELEQSRREWGLLKEYASTEMQNPYTQQPMQVPLATAMFNGPELANAVDEKPELFLLLSREARAAGVRVSDDDVKEIVTNYVHRPPTDDESADDLTQQAVTDLLLIKANRDRMSTAIKVSKPARDQQVARLVQSIKLDVVEFAASRYSSSASAPTPQQVEEQFKRYANTPPGAVGSADNPFGFGYRLPERVRLQFLTVQQADIKAAVEASMLPYDWDVKANLYYLQNPQNFPTTQAAAAATQPALGPTVKPFAEVHDEVMRQVRAPMIEKLTLDAQTRLVSSMTSSWSASTVAAAPVVADLQKIADTVSKQLHLPIHVTDLSNDELSAQQLGALPGIGAATTGNRPFAAEAITAARLYLADRSRPDALHQLSRPAVPVIDSARNVYVYRLAGAAAAQPAPDVASMQSRINGDLRTVAGYTQAKTAAEAMLTTAEKIGLRPAAVAAGQPVLTTDSFSGMPGSPVSNISLSEQSRPDFIRQSFDLLGKYDPEKEHNPMALIEVPQDGRVFVVRLDQVKREFDVPLYMVELDIDQQMRQQLMRPFVAQWFDYDSVVQRLGYKPVVTASQS